jgi:Ca2+-dependent lipid-binding protein
VPNLAGKPVPAGSRRFLDYAPLWAKWPDVDQVLFVNRIIKTLWPRYNAAIGKIATDVAGPILEEVCKKVPAGILQAVDIERLDLGGYPLAIGGIKTYATKDDSCIFEAPIQWGSALAVRVAARLKLGPFVVHVPIDVENVQVRAVARVSLRPLVDELPCLGGAEVSLLELPHVDLSLRIVNAVDIMRVPGVKAAVDAAIAKVVGDMALYPNRFRVDLMPGGGVPPPPLGMVEVAIERVERITDGGTLFSKVDPYVEVRCRKGRVTRTRTLYNTPSPVYNETIAAIVDDPDNQALHVSLYDDNGGYNDKCIGELDIPLLTSDFFASPRPDV